MLIFSNGIATFSGEALQDIGEDGLPIVSSVSEHSQVACYIDPQAEGKDGSYDEGKFKRGSYTVSLDYDSVGEVFNPSRVHLVHDKKGDLGIFQVQRIEFYELTRTIQIWV